MTNVALSLLVLKTHQLDEVRYFYETIGIQLAQEKHGAGPVHFAGRVGGVVVEIYPHADGQKTDATTRIGFVVEDLGRVLRSLENRELSPPKEAKQTEWGLRAVIKDPDARSVELYQRSD